MKLFSTAFYKPVITTLLLVSICQLSGAQNNIPKWSPEEQLELFSYCNKPALMSALSISAETADKIGTINYWATLQKRKIETGTNDTFATVGEVNMEVVKKFKNLAITGSRLETLNNLLSVSACPLITLSFNHAYDSLTKAQMIPAYKSKYRKMLIDQLGINGRQADMLIEAEAWKQKEALAIAAIPENDFNRVRKTVGLHRELDKKYRMADISDQQKEAAKNFFLQHQL
ncbi:MAG TPA: hypothetical protein VJ552_14155 [Sediminibacterium sp.]|nr:hypothetical protein [Sediminibacterium sp.]